MLEALALGTPVIATSKAVEGLDVTADSDVLIADNYVDCYDPIAGVYGQSGIRWNSGNQGKVTVTGNTVRNIDNTSGLDSRVTPIRYPKVGEKNARRVLMCVFPVPRPGTC